MSFRKLVVVALAFLPASHVFAQSSDCLRRTVLVSVVDKNGALVEGLIASDFRAEFQGKPVKILSVARDDGPRRIVILLDASGSMFGMDGMKWSLARATAFHLAQSNLPKTSLALMIFRANIVERVDFSQGTTAVSERLKQVGEDTSGETALFDTVLEGLRLLGPSSQGDVIYAITDGDDNKSRNSVREVQQALESAGVRVFALIPSHLDCRMPNCENDFGKFRSSPPVRASNLLNLLQLVDETGGMQLEPIESTPVGVTLDEDERHRIAKVLQIYYQQMLYPYRVEIELPQMPEKPSRWQLKLSDVRSHEMKHHQIAYPQELMPCASTASPK